MFDTINDEGQFVLPNLKTYIGALEFETFNSTYFRVEEKEYTFKVDNKYDFKIVALTDEKIQKSKKLRLETIPFDTFTEAKNFIDGYMPSLRAFLLKKGYKYKAPLTPTIKELISARSCVGNVKIELTGNGMLAIDEVERFHNENGIWYRLFSMDGMSISNACRLCVETDAFGTSDEAMNSINKLLPLLNEFLNKEIGHSYNLSEPITSLYMSVNATGMSVEMTCNMSLLTPLDIKLTAYKKDNIFVLAVLDLLEYKGYNDLLNLYVVLELIMEDTARKEEEFYEKVASLGLSTRDEIKKFRKFVNTINNAGLKQARHGKDYSGNPNPENMHELNECKEIMKNFVDNWLEYKLYKEDKVKEIL